MWFVLKTQTSPNPSIPTRLQLLPICLWLPVFIEQQPFAARPPAVKPPPRLTFSQMGRWEVVAVLVAGAATRLEGKHNTEGVFFSHLLVSWLHFCQNFTLWSEKYQKTVISCLTFEGKPHLSFLVFVFSDFCPIIFLGKVSGPFPDSLLGITLCFVPVLPIRAV